MAFTKQENQAVYILHTYPFKETSLIVELFTQPLGRVSVVAKGARRPRSSLRGMFNLSRDCKQRGLAIKN